VQQLQLKCTAHSQVGSKGEQAAKGLLSGKERQKKKAEGALGEAGVRHPPQSGGLGA
jgi:hypothetical protein